LHDLQQRMEQQNIVGKVTVLVTVRPDHKVQLTAPP
jgi:hypothetical protein